MHTVTSFDQSGIAARLLRAKAKPINLTLIAVTARLQTFTLKRGKVFDTNKKTWPSRAIDKYVIIAVMCPPNSDLTCVWLKMYHSGTAIAMMATTVKTYALTFFWCL